MKIRKLLQILALVGGFAFAAQAVSADCGSCGVGDSGGKCECAADCDAGCCSDGCAAKCCSGGECLAVCESECCLESGHALKGEVVGVHAERRMLIVKHEKIEGVMAAMTMGFAVPENFDLSTLKSGDRITARMVRNDNGFALKFIKKQDKAS